jgi:hypothetical protein
MRSEAVRYSCICLMQHTLNNLLGVATIFYKRCCGGARRLAAGSGTCTGWLLSDSRKKSIMKRSPSFVPNHKIYYLFHAHVPHIGTFLRFQITTWCSQKLFSSNKFAKMGVFPKIIYGLVILTNSNRYMISFDLKLGFWHIPLALEAHQ